MPRRPSNLSRFTTEMPAGCACFTCFCSPPLPPLHSSDIRGEGVYPQAESILPRYSPIPEAELRSTVFARVYDQSWSGEDQDPNDSHRLAVLFMVFALGTLMDLDKPYLSVEATQYYQLARASLALDSILEHQSIPAIQALVRRLNCPNPMSTDAC